MKVLTGIGASIGTRTVLVDQRLVPALESVLCMEWAVGCGHDEGALTRPILTERSAHIRPELVSARRLRCPRLV